MKLRFCQVDLVGGILKTMGRLLPKGACINPRQMNAVIAAADGIIAALERDDVPVTPGMGAGGVVGAG